MEKYKKITHNIIMLAVMTCVIITALCGCAEDLRGISDIIKSYYAQTETEETQESSDAEKTEGAKEEENKKDKKDQKEEKAAKEGSSEAEAIEVPDIYYAYHSLNAEEQKLYLEILDALQNMSVGVTVSTLDVKQLDKCFECVMRDRPELFYVEGFRYTEHLLGDVLTKISFEGMYSATKEEAEAYAIEIDRKLSECIGRAPVNDDEYSIVKHLYDYLIANTEYDAGADNNQNIRSVFLGGRSVCQGYAKAMQYMLQKAGIQSFLVTGYTGGVRHAWNLTRVNGQYYYLDPTWGDASYSYSGSEDMEQGAFYPSINYDYFLVTADEISKTHSFEPFLELPDCDSTQDNYYVREGLFFESYDREQLENIFNSDAVKAEDYVTLKCANREVYSDMLSAVIDERQIFGIINSNGGSISYASNDELCTISFWNIY